MGRETKEFQNNNARFSRISAIDRAKNWLGKNSLRRRSDYAKVHLFQSALTKIPGPKTGVLFPLTVLPVQPKKGAAVSPLNCRVEIPEDQLNF